MSLSQNLPKFSGFIRRLVDENFLSATQMQLALQQAQQSKISIVAYLVEQLNIAPLHIAENIALEFSEVLFDLDAYNPEFFPKNLISDQLLHQHLVLPLMQRGKVLALATSDPTDIAALDAIRFSSNLTIEPIIVEYDKLCRLIHQYHPINSGLRFGQEELKQIENVFTCIQRTTNNV